MTLDQQLAAIAAKGLRVINLREDTVANIWLCDLARSMTDPLSKWVTGRGKTHVEAAAQALKFATPKKAAAKPVDVEDMLS